MSPRRKRYVIAMDGPAGVGKSTVGSLVAKSLGYKFINTGEMYRALTWKALKNGIPLAEEKKVLELANELVWEFKPIEEGGTTLRTFINGDAVTTELRDEKVSENSSIVAANVGVRKLLCRLQRRLGRGGGIVMEGRDITTNVFPDADFKIYLDASLEERAKRRARQLESAHHDKVKRQKVKEGILMRDLNDLKRKINPLSCPPDAIVIDSTHMTLHEVADKILRIVRNGKR